MKHIIPRQSTIITLDIEDHTALLTQLEQLQTIGFSCIELNNATPELITTALKAYPSLRLGAGNIINHAQLEAARHAGAHFGSSPGFMPGLVQTADIYDFPYLPGIATPSEAMQAVNLGCQHVRPLPATLSFCKFLNKHFPKLRLYPADVRSAEVKQFFALNTVYAISISNVAIKTHRSEINHS